jgi:hypothetical protein|tara:strand:- start:43 stop:168 length:126 start_codon:yes stop_codon:yes gene_type:complete
MLDKGKGKIKRKMKTALRKSNKAKKKIDKAMTKFSNMSQNN